MMVMSPDDRTRMALVNEDPTVTFHRQHMSAHATGDATMTAPRPSGSHLGPACAPACPSLRQAPFRPVRGTQVPGLGERDVRVSVTGRCDGVCGHTHSHNDGTCHMNTGNRNTNGCGVTGKGGHEFETQPESWDCRCACVLHVLPM